MRRIAAAVAVLAVLVAVEVAANRWRRQVDLTADQTLTLSPATQAVLDSVDRRVEITAFLRRSDPARVAMTNLLSRYRQEERRVSFRVLDPDESAAEAQRLGVDPVAGGTAVVAADETEIAPTPTEQDLTAALARLLRPGQPTICMTSGHGEASNAALRDLLAQRGYRVTTIDLLSRPEIPTACDVVVVGAPTAPFAPEASAALVGAINRGGGRFLVLADPGGTADLSPLTSGLGVVFEKGLVLEGDERARPPDDPFRPIVSEYRSAHPVVRRLAPTMFPTVQGVLAPERTAGGTTVTPLARTSSLSYLERRPSTPRFDENEDLPGPVVVAAAVDSTSNRGGEVVRTRLIAVGDGDFVSDAFLNTGGNAAFVTRAVDWLALDEDIVSVEANIASLRPLELTEGRLTYARLLGAVIVPGMFLLIGALVWASRRGR